MITTIQYNPEKHPKARARTQRKRNGLLVEDLHGGGGDNGEVGRGTSTTTLLAEADAM